MVITVWKRWRNKYGRSSGDVCFHPYPHETETECHEEDTLLGTGHIIYLYSLGGKWDLAGKTAGAHADKYY